MQSLVDSDTEYLKVKNSDGRNPLYYAMHLGKEDITNMLILKQDISKLKNSHIYLHKAIRLRNHKLVRLLLSSGVNPDSEDDQGSNALHILFNSFTKDFLSCSLIGDEIMKHPMRVNLLNKEYWAPIHIATRRSSVECIYWILNKNSLLLEKGREIFNFNLPGKSQWTPLHLSVNAYRFVESMLILDQGVSVLYRNEQNKSPKMVANGNYLMTKILRNYELSHYKSSYLCESIQNTSGGNINKKHKFSSAAIGGIQTTKKNDSTMNLSCTTIFVNRMDDSFAKREVADNESRAAREAKRISSLCEYNIVAVDEECNLEYHYEILINDKISYAEKFDSLLKLQITAINNSNGEVMKLFRTILEDLDPKFKSNLVVFTEILSVIANDSTLILFDFLKDFKVHLEDILTNSQFAAESSREPDSNDMYLKYLVTEVENTIMILSFKRKYIRAALVQKENLSMSNKQKKLTSIDGSFNKMKKARNDSQLDLTDDVLIEPLSIAKYGTSVPASKIKDFGSYDNDSTIEVGNGSKEDFLHGAFNVKVASLNSKVILSKEEEDSNEKELNQIEDRHFLTGNIRSFNDLSRKAYYQSTSTPFIQPQKKDIIDTVDSISYDNDDKTLD